MAFCTRSERLNRGVGFACGANLYIDGTSTQYITFLLRFLSRRVFEVVPGDEVFVLEIKEREKERWKEKTWSGIHEKKKKKKKEKQK